MFMANEELNSPPSWMAGVAAVMGAVFVVLLVALMLAATYYFVKRARSTPHLLPPRPPLGSMADGLCPASAVATSPCKIGRGFDNFPL